MRLHLLSLAAVMAIVGALPAGASAMPTPQKIEHVEREPVFDHVRLRSGAIVSGRIVAITDDDKVIMERKRGGGMIRHRLPFRRIDAPALHAVLSTALSPLDERDHRRIADVAFTNELFATAARHYAKTAPEGRLAGDVLRKIQTCHDRDVTNLMRKSRTKLEKEDFFAARRLAMHIMRRHRGHETTKKIPAYLEEISRRYEDAKRRDRALANTRRARAMFRKKEAEIAKANRWLDKAESAERQALRASSSYRRARQHIDAGLRFARNANDATIALRQDSRVPMALRPKVIDVERTTIDTAIRLHLHLASLLTVRGSFGTALSEVNYALAIDPTNKSALDARARVEQASAAASGRGFGRR